jgi:hypothetical protein
MLLLFGHFRRYPDAPELTVDTYPILRHKQVDRVHGLQDCATLSQSLRNLENDLLDDRLHFLASFTLSILHLLVRNNSLNLSPLSAVVLGTSSH